MYSEEDPTVGMTRLEDQSLNLTRLRRQLRSGEALFAAFEVKNRPTGMTILDQKSLNEAKKRAGKNHVTFYAAPPTEEAMPRTGGWRKREGRRGHH
jgi:hypothetical protein